MLKVEIADGNGGDIAQIKKRSVDGHPHKYPAGVMTYTTPYRLERNRAISARDENGSSNMNVNGSVSGGTPDNIHDGTDSALWTGSNLTGSNFVFDSTTQAQAGTKSIDGSATVDNDAALFTRSSAIAHADYSALTGWIYITRWPGSGTKDVRIRFRLAGTDIGTEIDLSTYIVTGTQNSWQAFTIPISDFALSGVNMDEMVVTTVDLGGGQPPDYFLDGLSLSDVAGGAPVSFRVGPNSGEIILMHGFVYNMVFPWSTIATVAGATENFVANQFLTYNKFAHLSELTSGITVRRVQNEVVGFSNVIKNNWDLLKATNHEITIFAADDTNVMMKISTKFEAPVELDGETGDYYEFVINDDLTSLLEFEIRGRASTITEATD